MAWYCRRCDAFMLFNSRYCDNCEDIRWERENAREKVRKKALEEKKKKIHLKISSYKKEQILQIKKKHSVSIEFISEDLGNSAFAVISGSVFDNTFVKKEYKVNIISKDKTQQSKIDNLKKEIKELKESIEELEAVKNETLK